MTYGTYAPRSYPRFDRRRSAVRTILPQVAPSVVIAVCTIVGGFLLYGREPADSPKMDFAATPAAAGRLAASQQTRTPAHPLAPPATSKQASVRSSVTPTPIKSAAAIDPSSASRPATSWTGLLDPKFSFGAAPVTFALNMPLQPQFVPSAEPAAAPPAQIAALEQAPPTEEAPPVEPEAPAFIPLPLPRPPMLGLPTARVPLRPATRRLARQEVPLATRPPDRRTFFEKLFNTEPAPGPALAYAAPEDNFFGRGTAPARGLPPDRWTAVYDISAHTVYLPNGTRLEAHSGLREKIDNPRFVSFRMHGATPPAVYELTPRETLFHGVRALRLTPIGGGNTYGRTGLLAHTYMLGPSGQSNGCVSFRNYNAFLQAYQRGEIRRLVVVAHLS